MKIGIVYLSSNDLNNNILEIKGHEISMTTPDSFTTLTSQDEEGKVTGTLKVNKNAVIAIEIKNKED